MIDTHCHLLKEYYSDLEEVIKKMEKHIIIVSGTCTKDNKEVLSLCQKYSNVYATIGIHPEEIDNLKEEDFLFIENNLLNPKVVGIGEIGLDYYYSQDKTKQQEVFIRQIELAKRYHKPIVVHSRDAIAKTYEILKEYAQGLKIDIHAYSGSVEMAKEFIKLGCKLGIGGVLTFKNGQKLKEVVKEIDLKYLLLETDSPFLTPEPYRGKRNEPYNVLFVAQEIAKIKEIAVDEVLKITTNNAVAQFDLPSNL